MLKGLLETERFFIRFAYIFPEFWSHLTKFMYDSLYF